MDELNNADITTQNQKRLHKIISEFPNAELIFIDMNQKFENLWKEIIPCAHYSKEILYKLIAASIFLQYDKLIVTDVDVVLILNKKNKI